ncbi:MAG: hypothetical protein GY810_17065 [Aureispira sp.]|nr:hypothetical protein [Aureispira sp.]
MGCSNCSCGSNGTSEGCGKSGGCSTGSCNKLNTFDWLSDIALPEHENYNIIEVSFKKGARKEFYKKPDYIHLASGDYVTVEGSSGGFDIGQVSLMGELVKIQMKKKRLKEGVKLPNVVRQANDRDVERLHEARSKEHEIMIRARVISRELGLQMKIGDVEYQGDKRKVTFYYTADGRVDFRELIRIYAKEFKVKIEMRQIGARQESARIGGLGACGRELCCSTWLTDFKSVSTLAARYQNLAINQSKLSGQCGRLKCCLNYELNTYLDALQDFPRHVNRLETRKGTANLIKTDIFKRIMYFAFFKEFGASEIHALPVERVKEVHKMNKEGKKPDSLIDAKMAAAKLEMESEVDFIDGTGVIELEHLNSSKKKRRRKRKSGSNRGGQNKGGQNKKPKGPKNEATKQPKQQSKKAGNNSKAGVNKKDERKPRPNNKNRRPKQKQKQEQNNSSEKPTNNSKPEQNKSSKPSGKNRNNRNRRSGKRRNPNSKQANAQNKGNEKKDDK